MKKYLYIILILFCGSFVAQAQKEKKIVQPTERQVLEEARSLKDKDPSLAIKRIESILQKRKKVRNLQLEAEAYMLLGEIYEEIDQPKLALERYEQAGEILSNQKGSHLQVKSAYYIGGLHLKENNLEASTVAFNLCLSYEPSNISCQEGLAELSFLKKKYKDSYNRYSNIQSTYKSSLDSLSFARLEAKKTQSLMLQNRLEEARSGYLNSVNTLPDRPLKEEDIVEIEKASELIISNVYDTVAKIDMRKENIRIKQQKQLPPESVINEQLEIADLYIERGDVNEAEKYVEASKKIVGKAKPEQQAKVFEKDIIIQQQKGKSNSNGGFFSTYSTAKTKELAAKDAELKRKIDVFNNQSKIDKLDNEYKIKQKDEQLLEGQLRTQQIVIGLLSLLLLAALVSFYFIIKNVRARRKANQLLLLKSLRTQMNPHFIFNALNSVNGFIANNDERAANKFLTSFSRLMRMVLDFSQKDFIAFEDELDLIKLYLQLEHGRFKDKFDYTFEVGETENHPAVNIPPMLIQPFIENAVWHGLRYKKEKEKGQLDVTVEDKKNHLLISIIDNGIGRAKSKELKTSNQKNYKSTGLENVGKRIELINAIYGKNYEISVEDAFEEGDVGTMVRIKIPVE